MTAAADKPKTVLPQTTWGKVKHWGKAALFTFVLPTSWKRFAVFALCWGMLQPMAGRLFPRAEDVLKNEGVDPAVVQMLAPGKKVYVRQGENPLARAHALFDVTAPFAPWHYWSQMRSRSPVAAYTVADNQDGLLRLPLKLVPESQRPCVIYMKPKSETKDAAYLRAALERKAGHALTWKEPLTLTRDDVYRLTLLHEIRHCSNANQALEDGYQQESDATWEGLKAYAKVQGQPGLIEAFQKESGGIPVGGAYDVALYIEAKRQGREPPVAEEIDRAAAIISPLQTDMLKKKLQEAMGGCAKKDANVACLYHPPAFPTPLVKQRYALLDQAVNHILDTAPKKAPPRKPANRKPTA